MGEQRLTTKPEIATQKKELKLAPAIGDWTTYKPLKIVVKKIKTGLYGFDRLSKEELNKMLLIHYRFIQSLTRHLRIDLGLAVELYSVRVEQTTYLNFLRNLSGSMVQLKIERPDSHESILLLLELNLANSIINYSLGSLDLENLNRGLTETEKEILITALAEYLPEIGSSFAGAITNLSLSIVSSPDVTLDPTISPASTFTSFIAETALADNAPGKIYIGYSGRSIKELLASYKQKEQAEPLDFSRLPQNLLSVIGTSIAATLGETFLTTNDLNQLEIGDIVSLDTAVEDAMTIKLGKNIKLAAQPGRKRDKLAVRILELKDLPEFREAKPLQPPSLPMTKPTPPPPVARPAPKPMTSKPLPKPLPKPAAKAEAPADDFLDDFGEDDFLDDDFEDDKL